MSNYSKNIWSNGKIIPFNEAKIHILSHCIHYGTGVFEGIKCYNTPKGPAVFRLREHMERLINSGSNYNMEVPYSANQLCKGTLDLVRANNLKNSYIRPIAYYGYDTLGVHPKNCPVDVAVGTLDWGAYVGKDALEKGAHVTISPWKKYQSKSFPANTKSSGTYLNSLLAVQDAKSRGFDEALLLNLDGTIAEGSGQNFFIIKIGIFHTNDKNANILMGITRSSIIEISRDLNYSVEITDLSEELLMKSDEAFFTGTASEVTPIRSIEGNLILNGGVGVISSKLRDYYMNIVLGNNQRYSDWLSILNQDVPVNNP